MPPVFTTYCKEYLGKSNLLVNVSPFLRKYIMSMYYISFFELTVCTQFVISGGEKKQDESLYGIFIHMFITINLHINIL